MISKELVQYRKGFVVSRRYLGKDGKEKHNGVFIFRETGEFEGHPYDNIAISMVYYHEKSGWRYWRKPLTATDKKFKSVARKANFPIELLEEAGEAIGMLYEEVYKVKPKERKKSREVEKTTDDVLDMARKYNV